MAAGTEEVKVSCNLCDRLDEIERVHARHMSYAKYRTVRLDSGSTASLLRFLDLLLLLWSSRLIKDLSLRP
jgi:hypothetical protein